MWTSTGGRSPHNKGFGRSEEDNSLILGIRRSSTCHIFYVKTVLIIYKILPCAGI
jgi:hypothetical protein